MKSHFVVKCDIFEFHFIKSGYHV